MAAVNICFYPLTKSVKHGKLGATEANRVDVRSESGFLDMVAASGPRFVDGGKVLEVVFKEDTVF